jgi:hypothetical protein
LVKSSATFHVHPGKFALGASVPEFGGVVVVVGVVDADVLVVDVDEVVEVPDVVDVVVATESGTTVTVSSDSARTQRKNLNGLVNWTPMVWVPAAILFGSG